MTAHFSFNEFTDSDTAVRLGIDNTPSSQVAQRLFGLMENMEDVRSILGNPVVISSGYRGETLEKVLCDKDYKAWCKRRGYIIDLNSWSLYFAGKAHPQGFACDFTCPGFGSPNQIVTTLSRELRFDQLICEGTWVHVSFDPRLRMQVMNANFVDGTPTYTTRPM